MEWMILKQKVISAIINVNPLPKPAADDARLQLILSTVFIVIGAIALLLITIGGFRYVVSHGDPSATAQAKNTVMYALIGLVVAIVGVSIVNFVVMRVT